MCCISFVAVKCSFDIDFFPGAFGRLRESRAWNRRAYTFADTAAQIDLLKPY